MKNLKGKIKHHVISELRFKHVLLAVHRCDYENEFGSEDSHSSQLIKMVVNEYLYSVVG